MTKRTVTAVQSVKADNSFWQPVSAKSVDENSATHVAVDSSKTYQTWMGFGGALTESATYTLDQLSEDKKKVSCKLIITRTKG
ncbi:MAG: hypothetical protein U5K84_06720 [Alkalibacterium sp.]|nr:hypothetical protein [Alkalibacterium sp.]